MMSGPVNEPQATPLPGRCAVVGAGVAGVSGAIGGLIVGLLTYPPTAWFAVLEAGIPASLIGGILGLCTGLVALGTRRIRQLISRRTSISRDRNDTAH